MTRNLPYSWYDTPNRHVLTIKDFREFCEKKDIAIEREIHLYAEGQVHLLPNLFAEEALYVLTAMKLRQ